MKGYSVAIVMISMIFDVIVVIFVIVSCILIYSMLMINVDTKTFENGIMRMVGLTKKGFCFVILVQANLFVIPSVICAFVAIIPMLYVLYGFLFSSEEGYNPTLFPKPMATT
jgi:ABC-type antimicrobial peptide transport system permease subunit